jgi:hypothetical protein
MTPILTQMGHSQALYRTLPKPLMLARCFFKPPFETGVRRHSSQTVEGYSV